MGAFAWLTAVNAPRPFPYAEPDRQDGGVPTSGVAQPKALAGVAAGVPVPYSGVTAIATSGEAAAISRSGVAAGEAAGVPHIAGAPISSSSVVASSCATEMVAPPITKNANATITIKRRMVSPPDIYPCTGSDPACLDTGRPTIGNPTTVRSRTRQHLCHSMMERGEMVALAGNDHCAQAVQRRIRT